MINNKQFTNFIKALQDTYTVVAPVKDKERGQILIKQIKKFSDIDWSGQIPLYSFKKFFLKPTEELLRYGDSPQPIKTVKEKPLAILGINLLDLRALGMLDLVFKRDPYYQKNRLRNLIIGFNNVNVSSKNAKTFAENFEENVLEHLSFDIFFEKKVNQYTTFRGSRLGQKILNKYSLNDYEHIAFAGFIQEEGRDPQMLKLYDKVKNSANSPIWQKLAEQCYACGKCSSVCPTCYCFDLYDVIGLDDSKKIRQWGSCFYPEFSQVAGDHKFLDTIAKRMYYWYYHKFVAIPEKYSVPGCVSCLRCVKTCPAGIDIRKVLASL